jgi:hypothetical protein
MQQHHPRISTHAGVVTCINHRRWRGGHVSLDARDEATRLLTDVLGTERRRSSRDEREAIDTDEAWPACRPT